MEGPFARHKSLTMVLQFAISLGDSSISRSVISTGPSKCTALGPAFQHKLPNAIELNIYNNNAPAVNLKKIDRLFEYNQFRKQITP
jgi:hypothetical protein